MSDEIPFDRSLAFEYGRVDWLKPRVRRLIANNPGPFTFVGTNTYIVGVGRVAVIDPGPDDPAHFNALIQALAGERVEAILVTHTHRDHSPLATRLAAATGAPVLAEGPHRAARELALGEINPLDAAADTGFRPTRALVDGEVVRGPDWTLETVTTPGHTANHLAFALREEGALFSGDHVMAWSTSIVAPPDGAMAPYMASLRKLAARPETTYWPGHGGPVENARAFSSAYVKHRLMRERAILDRLTPEGIGIPDIVAAVYAGLDPKLHGAAALSVLAHLEDLVGRGAARAVGGDVTLQGVYASGDPA
jgi:glyoxylase-like metal-dependent hydrolase (beta-lactamase superfamily II)